MLVGEKAAVTPCGAPLTDNATAELNPLNLAIISVKDVELPTFTLAPVGLGVSVKVGAMTVIVIATVRVNPPPVPVKVIGQLPATALAPADTVTVTGAAVVRVEEEKVTVTPVGAPAADSVTGELNPPWALTVRVVVAGAPWPTLTLEEFVDSVKLEAPLFFQLLTSRNASTEPSPVTIS